MQQKGNMEIYFVTKPIWVLNIYVFASASENGLDFIFHETNFENLKKLESTVNIFVLFVFLNFMSKQTIPPPF